MPEYWKSYKRIWCEYCRTFYLDNAINRRNHENSPKHIEKLKLRVDAMRRKAEMEEDSTSSNAKRVSYYGSDLTSVHSSNLVFQSGYVSSVGSASTPYTFDAAKIMSSSAKATTKIERPIYLDPSDSILGSWTQVEEQEESQLNDQRQIPPAEVGWTGGNKPVKKDAPKLPLKLKSLLSNSNTSTNEVLSHGTNIKEIEERKNTINEAIPSTTYSTITSRQHVDDTAATPILPDDSNSLVLDVNNFTTKASLRRGTIRKREED